MDERKRVLVADDWADLGESTALLLDEHGYDVRWIATPRAAIRAAKEFTPDFAVIDLEFRGNNLSGFHVCEWLRRHLPRCVRIAYSGHGGEATRARVQEAGFHHFLLKPSTVVDLLQVLAAAPQAL